ncbi:hypothetical protein A2V56_00285 [Candidatus Woesebacteria bacterium RBG_19FT_COMBO_42_9]|uniref:Methyltransferase type 11 domain-containing protein n=1 Tax=Candidatus Woesebacteria bacterium RBG_16_42_24 TaxID=1802485 RepID=A0A1F7XKM6_9BACT|nr:MAG: hypothetical protein A2V97_00845 [Candidatus Woesebacteria bacterium RBG_16_42_24]OGM16668.1 MAG: hypothetical protein A2V56_00285 [Candidatus Woesebacteria bacterium RBG_19FT_COMBO_42_9]OGM67943.1 MAG: hypothetical protein A2985_01925 [Candidatus Woesebacteria bacterium RIFCSPLOWO2_01_FULL_43_11]
MISDREVISRFKIKPKDRILDIGGSMRQRDEIRVDTLVDIISPEEAPYGPTKLRAKNFVKVDVTRDKLPFADKEFDFCICSHTLEDLSYPFLAIEEMSRVAKRGLIVTPSMGADMVFSHINFTDWLTGSRRVPGQAHHKWLFYEKGEVIYVVPKNYPLLYSSNFHFTHWSGEEEFVYYWEDKIDHKEVRTLHFHELIHEYKGFVKRNKSKLKRGSVLFYLDSPFYYLKEGVKLLLKKGTGFKYRNNS